MTERFQMRSCLGKRIWEGIERSHEEALKRHNKFKHKIVTIMALEKFWRIVLLVYHLLTSQPDNVQEHYERDENASDKYIHLVFSYI